VHQRTGIVATRKYFVADPRQYRLGRQRQAVGGDPVTQQVALARRRQFGERRQRETARVLEAAVTKIHGRQGIGQLQLVGLVCRGARQDPGDARPVLLQVGHDPLAQQVAVVPQVGVAGVLHPAQTLPLGIGANRLAAHIQQRPYQPAAAEPRTFRHGRQAPGAGAAKQLQQQRLGLIIEMLGGHQHGIGRQPVGQAPVACRARRRLGTFAAPRLCLHPQYVKTDTQFLAHRATMNLPVTGLALQLVVDVHGSQRSRQLGTPRGQQMQQNVGIDAAAVGDPVGGRRRQSVQ
jgi:hypothetical protein